VRRPPPIAGLFALLAVGLAVIAVAAWDGGAKVPAFAALVLAAWMAGIVLKMVLGLRRRPPGDSSIR
jgi:peptidoglycan/LPS O-acetylase OafA/YrhL